MNWASGGRLYHKRSNIICYDIFRIQLSESILFTVHALPNSKSLSELLSSIGMTGLIFSDDFNSHQQHKLKISFSKIYNLNLHQNKFWKGLQGLSNIGIKWSNSDVNLR